MLIDDYTPTKRLGIEEAEGLMNALDNRISDMALDKQDETAAYHRYEGAWLTVHLLLTGRFRTQEDFLAVFDNKCKELL